VAVSGIKIPDPQQGTLEKSVTVKRALPPVFPVTQSSKKGSNC